MKYVRTKDGIYELMFPNEEQQMSFDHKTIEPAYYTINNDWIAQKDVINQADTIEELCDEFVVVSYSSNKVMYQTKDYNYFWSIAKKSYINHSTIRNECYGAIWTDKGLIYVAKMNNKGELELL